MPRQLINIGQSANDRSGDPLRTAFTKINNNFAELYTYLGDPGDYEITLELAGDVTGSVTFSPLVAGTEVILTTIGPDSVALGNNTTGNYVQSLSATNGLIIENGVGEGSMPVVSIDSESTISLANLNLSNVVLGVPVESTINSQSGNLVLMASGGLVYINDDLVVNSSSVNITSTETNIISPNVNVTGDLSVDGDITSTGTISFSGSVGSSIEPSIANTFDLGSASAPWRTLHVNSIKVDEINISLIDCGTY